MSNIGHVKWGKTPRLFNSLMTVTEKIDGTNCAIHIHLKEEVERGIIDGSLTDVSVSHVYDWAVYAQSRNRLLSEDNDNHGFARWVAQNAESLFIELGQGLHFGEWAGKGINRGYDAEDKSFFLFNTEKWDERNLTTPGLRVVPTMATGMFSEFAVLRCIEELEDGSDAYPGYMNPEGLCVYHHSSNKVFKYTLNGDGHKAEQ